MKLTCYADAMFEFDKSSLTDKVETLLKPNANPDGFDNPEGRALNRRVEIVLEPCQVAP